MLTALITDTHFGGRGDSVEFDSYFKKFYDEIFFPELKQRGIKHIIHLGDCFDRRKFVNFNSLKSCREYFFDKALEQDIKIDMIVGNHDTFYKNTNDVNSPNLLLDSYSNVTTYKDPQTIHVGGLDILMLPWLCPDNYEQSMKTIQKTPAKVCFGHLEILGFVMFKGQESHEGLDPKLFSKFDLVCSGHYHHRHTRGNITYLGNPYQMFWNDIDDPRGFHIFNTKTLQLEFIENTNTIFERYYYNDSKELDYDLNQFKNKLVKIVVEEKKDFYKFDKFIDSIYQNNPLELKIIEDMSEYEAENVSDDNLQLEDTLTLLSQYVENLETDADKEKIKTLMRTLYVEAQNQE